MTQKLFITLLISPALLLGACSTTPDPAKVCTAEWIEKRADRAMARIEKKAGKSIKSLSKAGEAWVNGKQPGPIALFRLDNNLRALERELTEGRGIRDLKTLAKTCDDPQLIADRMSAFLASKGMPDRFLNFIKSLKIYQRIIAPLPDETTDNI